MKQVISILLVGMNLCSQMLFANYSPGDTAIPSLKVLSPAFKNHESIPVKYTGQGDDSSPPIDWEEFPAATKSIAIICDDQDAQSATGEPWVHWVIFNIPVAVEELNQGIPRTPDPRTARLKEKALQGRNDFKKNNIGYRGPNPPSGRAHRYFFKVYAVDSFLPLNPGVTKKQLLEAMKGHVLAYGELVRTYKSKYKFWQFEIMALRDYNL